MSVSVSVTDDDTAGLSIISETRLTVTEDGSDTDFFEVKLNSAPPARRNRFGINNCYASRIPLLLTVQPITLNATDFGVHEYYLE